MRRELTFASVCVLALLVGMTTLVACSAGDGASEYDDDAGFRDTDALLAPELTDSGDGLDPCAFLVERTCGPTGTECREAPACEAALLVQRYEPLRCEEELSNPGTFPLCSDDACTKLMEKTCGAVPVPLEACATEPGCALAKDLYDDARDQDASTDDREDAREACAAGLEDGIVFAACAST